MNQITNNKKTTNKPEANKTTLISIKDKKGERHYHTTLINTTIERDEKMQKILLPITFPEGEDPEGSVGILVSYNDDPTTIDATGWLSLGHGRYNVKASGCCARFIEGEGWAFYSRPEHSERRHCAPERTVYE